MASMEGSTEGWVSVARRGNAQNGYGTRKVQNGDGEGDQRMVGDSQANGNSVTRYQHEGMVTIALQRVQNDRGATLKILKLNGSGRQMVLIPKSNESRPWRGFVEAIEGLARTRAEQSIVQSLPSFPHTGIEAIIQVNLVKNIVKGAGDTGESQPRKDKGAYGYNHNTRSEVEKYDQSWKKGDQYCPPLTPIEESSPAKISIVKFRFDERGVGSVQMQEFLSMLSDREQRSSDEVREVEFAGPRSSIRIQQPILRDAAVAAIIVGCNAHRRNLHSPLELKDLNQQRRRNPCLKLPHFPLPTHGVVVRGGIPNEFEDENGDVDVELSGACAGPLVTVPHVGDVVYYFPQCHLKQI
ncbi:hypothetical protein Scep_025651 [Stephania cephalantha]|uniref:Uncharacterized protein n=1 Tax=Stephania cephalantha TaxID=152367 RepID=A0AAP0HRD6_9MAGN